MILAEAYNLVAPKAKKTGYKQSYSLESYIFHPRWRIRKWVNAACGGV